VGLLCAFPNWKAVQGLDHGKAARYWAPTLFHWYKFPIYIERFARGSTASANIVTTMDDVTVKKINELNAKGDGKGIWEYLKDHDITDAGISQLHALGKETIEAMQEVMKNDTELIKYLHEDKSLEIYYDSLQKMLDTVVKSSDVPDDVKKEYAAQILPLFDKLRDDLTKLAEKRAADAKAAQEAAEKRKIEIIRVLEEIGKFTLYFGGAIAAVFLGAKIGGNNIGFPQQQGGKMKNFG